MHHMTKLSCLALGLLAGLTAARGAEANVEAARERVLQQYLESVQKLTLPEARPRFVALPPGAVKPEGWLLDWARAAAKGITGDLDNRAAVYGEGYKGKAFEAKGVQAEGTGWPLEQCAYWLDGLVRLAYILDDQALIAKARSRLDLVVDGVAKGGDSFVYWRPKTIFTNAFNNWAHSHMGRALVAYYLATGEQRILDVLTKVYRDFPLPDYNGAFTAPVNGLVNLDPLLETCLLSGDRQVLGNALAAARRPIFQEAVDHWNADVFAPGHCVIYYENLRVPALLYPFLGERRLLGASIKALDWGNGQNLLPYGLQSGEEYQAGIGATRNTETCNVAAAHWTEHWLLRLTGQGRFADDLEQIFFNAAPASVARDFQTMSYYQCPNRLGPQLPDEKNPPRAPGGGGSYRFTPIGHEVLCCVGNLNRVVPNYIMHTWQATLDGGLAATLYAPTRLRTQVQGQRVTISCATAYPFEETVRFTVIPDKALTFPLYLRIPQWCERPTLTINDTNFPCRADTNGFVQVLRQWEVGDKFTLTLPMQPRVVRGRETSYPDIGYFRKGRQLGTVKNITSPFASVLCGPLLFALPIADQDANTPQEGAEWNYALPGDLAPGAIEIVRQKMPAPWRWQLEDAPVQLRLAARRFDWQPTELEPLPKASVTNSRPARVTLVPYGCTKFRVSMFPLATSQP